MAAAKTLEKPTLSGEGKTGLRVLVVEDNAESAASLAILLRMDGHEVQVAWDGPTALEMAQADQPDVVLLDIGLPGGMDGYKVARSLQQQIARKKPLLVAITGLGSEADRHHSREAGIDLHLVKPADMKMLVWLLRRFQRIIDQ